MRSSTLRGVVALEVLAARMLFGAGIVTTAALIPLFLHGANYYQCGRPTPCRAIAVFVASEGPQRAPLGPH